MFRIKVICLVILTALSAAFFSACTSTKAPVTLTPINVQLAWTHQAQSAGMYAAEGLDITQVYTMQFLEEIYK